MRREKKFTMMFSEEEFAILRELAKRRGLSLSAFLRLPVYAAELATDAPTRNAVARARRRHS